MASCSIAQVAVFCDLCQSEEEIISRLCLVCNEYMCKQCSTVHQRSRASREHQIKHLNGVDIVALEQKRRDDKKKPNKNNKEINDVISSLTPMVKKLEFKKREIVKRNQNIARRNFIKTQNAIQLLSNHRDQVNKQNETKANTSIAIITNKQNKLEQVITELENLQTTVHHEAIQGSSDSEDIQATNEVKDIVSQIHPEEFDISRLSPLPLQEVELCNIFRNTSENSNIISRLKITAHPNGAIWSVCPISQWQAWVHIYADYPNYLINLSGEVEKIAPCSCYVTKFALTKDRKYILASSYYNMSIKMMSLNCVLQNDFRTGKQMQYPLGFCISGNGDVLVCMNKRDDSTDNIMTIKRFTRNGEVIRTISYESKYLQTDSVRGTNSMAENPINGDICLIERCDKTRGNLVILDKNGQKKATYNGRNENKEFDPLDIICDEKGKIILADRNNTVHLLTPDGQFLRYILSEEEGLVPLCLALDSVNSQLWVGCEEGSIIVYNYE